MNKLPVQKIKLSIFILSLIIASIACKHPDAVDAIVEAAVEDCSMVKRDVYELSAAQLGQTPETPEYPESAVYEVCFIDREVSSVRMIDGNNTEDEVSEENNNIPVGTYIYEVFVNDEPPPGGDDWEYELESEFTISVANDGTVTGFKTYRTWVDSVSATGCATRSEEGFTTNVSGFLEGNQGYAKLENKHWDFWEYHGEECGDGKDYFKDEEDVCDAIITISGNQMDISCQGQVIYTLIKE
jgi:hypothetical protein